MITDEVKNLISSSILYIRLGYPCHFYVERKMTVFIFSIIAVRKKYHYQDYMVSFTLLPFRFERLETKISEK